MAPERAASSAVTSVRPHRGVGIYLRKSSNAQGDLSLPAQERIIRAVLIEPSGQRVYQVYRDVLSGTRPDRADYQQMLADARAGKLTAVYFHKVNRFGRDSAEGLAAINELRRLGVEIRVADLPTLDVRKPEGMFVFSFLLAQGQYEVENLGSEAIKGMRERVLSGGWPFMAPDGYRNCREYLNAHKRRCWVEVDRPRAAIVRLIFRWYARGNVTLPAIASALSLLHARRIAQGKSGCLTKAGNPWNDQSLTNMLANPFYCGIVEVSSWDLRVQGAHRGIIDPATFAHVQNLRSRQSPGPRTQHTYMLQGCVVIVIHGIPYTLRCTTVIQKDRRYYYYCEGRRRRHFDADTIDAAVQARIRERIASLGADPCGTVARRMRSALAGAQARIRAKHDALKAQRKRLLRMATLGKFSEAEVVGEMFRLDADMADAEREHQRIAAMAEHQIQQITDWQQAIRAVQRWEVISAEEQQALVRRLIQQVEVDSQGNIATISWAVIWDELASD